ncbi:MAG: ShlB/FhaC/HecB family hemolysin secretion/activation protein [Nitrospirae bacterium]|nr:ShlB/FhaC/HecB family hemolysin secretion/activation protein [Nitrospirota bacterium]
MDKALESHGQMMDSPDTLGSIYVKSVVLEGNKLFSDEELSGITAPYINREITFEELDTLRQQLTLQLVNKGYINSGVVIPDQQLADGIIRLQLVQGYISRIDVEGNRWFRESYIANRLRLVSSAPLNINDVQDSLQLLQQDQRIKRINAELSPGVMPGEGVLSVKVEEERPYKVFLSFANDQSPSVGPYHGEVTLSHQNLFGFGDILEGRFGLTDGTTDWGVDYRIPINARDTTLRAYYRKDTTTVTDDTFKRLDIKSRSETLGVGLSHPFYRNPSVEFSAGLNVELRKDATFLLGRPFSFTDYEGNTTHITALRLFQEWVHRSEKEVMAVRSTFSLGIDAFGATIAPSVADGRFFSWVGQAQWLRRLTEGGIQAVFRIDAQLSDSPLLPMEKFSVGGMNSVRGYRENLLVRDNGVATSLEFRIPVLQNTVIGEGGALQFAPFADFGWSWNKGQSTPNPQTISSIGAGIRWSGIKKLNLAVYYGYGLRKVINNDHDLQDDGVHFQISYQLY